MPQKKITELAELTSPVGGDLLCVVDDPGGTPITKKITIANLLTLSPPPAWGNITGTLSAQGDLDGELQAKQSTSEKNAASGYAGLDASSKLTGSQQVYGSAANTACQGNDARLSDARTPTTHASSHQSGGGDAIKLDDLALPDDNTDLDVSTARHGLCPKLPGGTSTFLRADGTYAAPGGGGSATTVIKLASAYTNNSTTGTEVTGLGPVTLVAGSYHFRYALVMQSAATTTGWRLGINYTGTVTRLAVNMKYPSTGTAAATGIAEDVVANNTGSIYESAAARTESTTAPNLGPIAGVAAANTDILVIVEGVVTVSDGGDLELWCASEVASSQITIQAGSCAFVT